MANSHVLHESLKPLAWLLGKWRADNGLCQYPTFTKTLNYVENLSVDHVGQPYFNFNSISVDSQTKIPLHGETGFLRINPTDKTTVSLSLGHMHGMTEISEGRLIPGDKLSLVLVSHTMGCTTFGPAVQKIERRFTLIDEDTVEQVIFMETVCTELTEHCRSFYKKV